VSKNGTINRITPLYEQLPGNVIKKRVYYGKANILTGRSTNWASSVLIYVDLNSLVKF